MRSSQKNNAFLCGMWLLLITVMIAGCDNDAPADVDTQDLIGEWRLVEAKVGTGPPGTWEPVSDGDSYTFRADSTFTSTAYENCTGNFSVKNDILNFNLDCASGKVTKKFHYTLDGSLILWPADIMCIEGCLYKYQKVSD